MSVIVNVVDKDKNKPKSVVIKDSDSFDSLKEKSMLKLLHFFCSKILLIILFGFLYSKTKAKSRI